MPGLEARLSAHRGMVITLVVVMSVLLRVVYLAQATGGPLLDLHRSPASDMHFNHVFASTLSAGDWGLARPLHPLHPWHEALAAQHFAKHPGAEAALRAAAPASLAAAPPARLLWNRWYGETTFHQEPLYAYLLAVTYGLFGVSVLPMLWLQLAVGVAGNVLVYEIARRSFGERAGVLAAAFAVLSGPMLYYELLLLRDSLVAVLGLALVAATQRAIDRPSLGRWLSAGAAFGAGIGLKSSLALLWLAVVVGVAASSRGRRSVLRPALIGLAAGVAIFLAPIVLRNAVVGAPLLAFSSVGTVTFVAANTADYGSESGVFGDFFVSPRYAAAILGASDGRMWPAVVETLRTHEGPWSYVRQLVRKLGAILWWYEIPNNTNFYYFALHAPVLRFLPVTFLVVGPLAGIGLVLGAPGFRRSWPLYALVGTTLLVMLGFGVFSRLRLPLVPALLPFAALTIVRASDWAMERRLAPVLGVVAVWIALTAFTARPLPEGQPLIRPSDYSAAYVAGYGPAVDAAYERGNPCAAADVYAGSLDLEPQEVRRLAQRAAPRYPYEGQLAAIYRKVHDRYAAALEACRTRTADAASRTKLEERVARARDRVGALDAALAAMRGPP